MNGRIFGIVAMMSLLLLTSCWQTTRNAEHNGQVTAVELNGVVWPTWSVYVKTDISSSQEDQYCVEDQNLIPLMKNLSDSRAKVTFFYRDEFIIAPWRCSGSDQAIITGVKS